MIRTVALSAALTLVVAITATAQEPPVKPIAVHDFEVNGVEIALTEVVRTGDEVVTVRWQYHNKTKEPQVLAGKAVGWSDPYRLAWDSYLTDEQGRVKFKLAKDAKGVPMAAAHGRPVQKITVAADQTLKTWAKYVVTPNVKTVTVVIKGTEPFEAVPITTPPPGPR